jgi:hypothetical protein
MRSMATTDWMSGAAETESPVHRWSLTARIAFRFCFVYLGLFCVATQIFGALINIPNVDIPDIASLWPLKPLIFWTAAHVLQIHQTLINSGSGSGDKLFDWTMCFCFLVIAAVATIIWSVLDRRRPRYDGLSKWFRLFVRFALVGQMLTYGFAKVLPLQMPFPFLDTLIEPYGNFSPMGVLWSFIGASPAYEVICGSAELLCGLLLILPRTALLGALLSVGVAGQIFILNMTYDVPVKQLSLHLVLMALFLAAPELGRLSKFFFGNASVGPSQQPPLFASYRANRIALAVQIVFGLWLLGSGIYGSWTGWYQYGGGAPKSPLYGIWNVNRQSIDGHDRSPLLGDYGRWRRVIFDFPDFMNFQRMDDSVGGFAAPIDTKLQTIALTRNNEKNWKGTLHYQRIPSTSSAPEKMILDGSLDGHPTHLELELVDRGKFMLVNRGFHWVQEYPFNR